MTASRRPLIPCCGSITREAAESGFFARVSFDHWLAKVSRDHSTGSLHRIRDCVVLLLVKLLAAQKCHFLLRVVAALAYSAYPGPGTVPTRLADADMPNLGQKNRLV